MRPGKGSPRRCLNSFGQVLGCPWRSAMNKHRCGAISACVVLGLLAGAGVQTPARPATAEPLAYVASGLSDEDLVVFTTSLAAAGRPGVVLVDTPQLSKPNREFLNRYQAAR